jgi:Raf kinase inhibitor-like YbhB/YbcL family protein
MEITSSAFGHEEKIPSKYTCDGDNINPALSFSGIPAEAKGLALIMDDPDVPKHLRPDGMWDHWVVFNIPPNLASLDEGEEPPGVRGIGTGQNLDYYGPCPPDREHRYYFRLYALDTELDLPEGATKKEVESAMEGHILEQAVLMGRYERV